MNASRVGVGEAAREGGVERVETLLTRSEQTHARINDLALRLEAAGGPSRSTRFCVSSRAKLPDMVWSSFAGLRC